ncbi:MAG: M55 family metallopeptidase [Oscillospiraceae bacterium]|nr:M55 family metallopeptidase [Oscillospiraceae bacterium]
MTVLIMTDIEGISGVDLWEQVHKEDWSGFEFARERLMADTNAAVEGAVRAGADKIYVVDGHGAGTNFKPELLDKRAIQLSVADFLDIIAREKIDAYLEIGVHAKPGTINAFLEHTQSSKHWFAYRVNGKDYGEIVQSALYAGAYDVPFVMVSGDDATCREAKECIGENVAVAEVKRGLSWKRAESLPLDEAEKRIRDAAEDGIRRRNEIKPFKVSLPMTIEVTFLRADICEEYLEKFPNLEHVDSRTLRRVSNEIKTYKDVQLY